jgi:hypothetical protein
MSVSNVLHPRGGEDTDRLGEENKSIEKMERIYSIVSAQLNVEDVLFC